MIEFAFFFSILLIIYHHVGYPLLLKLCTKRRIESCVQQGPKHDFIFLLPFYNESQYIVEKVKNIASLDYPMNHVHVILANDGSNDDSLAKLQAHFADNDYAFSHEIINYTNNRGKLAVLNDLQEQVSKKAIAFFSDISAHLSKNTLQRANQYFQDNSIGAYSTSYQVKENTSEGAAKYLTYQNRIKISENYSSYLNYSG